LRAPFITSPLRRTEARERGSATERNPMILSTGRLGRRIICSAPLVCSVAWLGAHASQATRLRPFKWRLCSPSRCTKVMVVLMYARDGGGAPDHLPARCDRLVRSIRNFRSAPWRPLVESIRSFRSAPWRPSHRAPSPPSPAVSPWLSPRLGSTPPPCQPHSALPPPPPPPASTRPGSCPRRERR